ncbi:uncharacterized protein LOC110176000 [Drosophila serrata]|uniref:uncharacterized protein LOC110176000 n=1 Tax=Drosophila serrata TaxID=7274 RepID=UPI000A1CFE1D|nr:uncharacterized protein LOC110176000 [Drosophila serrata]XP_020797860.1 uncharacterized protein LOC110176000 [Drosophila serrata]
MEPRAALTSDVLGYGECTQEQLQDQDKLDHVQVSASSQSNNNIQGKQQQKQPPVRSSVILDIGLLHDTGAAAAEAAITRTIFMPQLSGLPYQGRDTQYSPAGLWGQAVASKLCAR